MTVPTSLVLVGGYGSLCLALVGGGAEGFSNASMRAIMQRVRSAAGGSEYLSRREFLSIFSVPALTVSR